MEKKSPLPADLVQEFVGCSHGNLVRVLELLAIEPTLVNASWDWGNGDWESGLGAAAHVGSRDIALELLERGARMDIFAAAMLGQLDIVHSILTAFPNLKDAPGPHGIPLIVHARMGGDDAAPVLSYLESLEP